MKPSLTIGLLATLLALSTGVAVAQPGAASARAAVRSDPSRGQVSGRVSNQALEVFLEGARVELVGSNRWVLTDREGRFELTNVPAGAVTIEVSYTGLDSQRMEVDVGPGQVVSREIGLRSEVYVMDKFTVASIREGQAAAITQQRNAANVKNVAANDAFGNIADGNAAEALRLLPGVSAINDQNESRFMMVRGIDSNLNSVSFDGMRLASGGSGINRQTGMSEIPLGAIEYLEVTKSPTPDMDGDSIGGNINLRPSSIFDRANPRRITYAFSGSGRILGGVEGSSAHATNRLRPTVSLGYADVLAGKFGVALNLSHTDNWVPDGGWIQTVWQQTAASPAFMRTIIRGDYISTVRVRTGTNLRLDYKLSRESQLFVNAFYTYYSSKQSHEGGTQTVTGLNQVATLDASGVPVPFQTQFPFGNPSYRAGGFTAAGARVQASILPGYTDQLTEMVNATYQFGSAPNTAITKRYSVQPGGRHLFGPLEIDYAAIYQESPSWTGEKNHTVDAIRAYQVSVLNTAWRLDGRAPYSVRRLVTQTGGADVRNPANWTLSSLTGTVNDRGTNIYGGQVNVKRNFATAKPFFLKAGLKFMSEERYSTNPNKTFTYAGPQSELANLRNMAQGASDGAGHWYDMPAIPRYLDVDKLNQFRNEHPAYFVENAATSLQNKLTNDKTATEEVSAGYLMGNVSLGRLSVLGGMRVEKTSVHGVSAVQDPLAATGITDAVQRIQAIWGRRVRVQREYTNVLPGIHFKYSADANTILRASYASTFGRPGFGTIFPDRRINYDTSTITQNNPGLKPQESSNYDVSIERYFEPVGVISAGVFRKDIRKFLYNTVVVIPSGADNGFDGDYAGWDLSTQASGGSARVQGLELNYSQQLSFLRGIWSGFGVFANFTYLETAGDYGRAGEAPNSELVNFTPRIASGGISYSRGRFTARVNANHTGAYLRAYNADPVLRSYRMPRLMVDLKIGFKVSRRLTLFADGSNIFNSGMVWFNGGNRDRVTDIRDHGVRIQAGINGSL